MTVQRETEHGLEQDEKISAAAVDVNKVAVKAS